MTEKYIKIIRIFCQLIFCHCPVSKIILQDDKKKTEKFIKMHYLGMNQNAF